MSPRPPRIDCPMEVFQDISTALQFRITGQEVRLGDTLVDLVERHCPEVYAKAEALGYRLNLNLEQNDEWALTRSPPEVWIEIVLAGRRH